MPSLVVVTLANVNGLSEDAVQNSFCIRDLSNSDTQQTKDDCAAAIDDFYNSVGLPGVSPVSWYLSDSLSRAVDACTVKFYDIGAFLDGSPHGSPFEVYQFTLDPAGDSAQVAAELALCVTLESTGRADAPVETADGGDPGTARDRPKQRHTNRIYLGPLNRLADNSGGSQSRPSAQFMIDARSAFYNLNLDLLAATSLGLGVWSRADATVRIAGAVSTDDAWDVQRRRGVAPTARTRLAF